MEGEVWASAPIVSENAKMKKRTIGNEIL
jgi:hypothetical protein